MRDYLQVKIKYTLPEDNNQIFASKYKLYLPTEEEFKKELNLDNYVKKEEETKKQMMNPWYKQYS